MVSVRVRLATTHDAAAVAAIYAPYVERTAISFEAEPPTPAEMASRIAATLPARPFLLAEDHDQEETLALGYAYAGQHSARAAYAWSVDVSVYVAEAAHRRGVGRALYRALFAVLERQGYRQAFAGIALPNPGSEALHEAMGFRLIGVHRASGWKHGRWHDVAWLQRPLTEGAETEPPGPIASLDDLVSGGVLDALLS